MTYAMGRFKRRASPVLIACAVVAALPLQLQAQVEATPPEAAPVAAEPAPVAAEPAPVAAEPAPVEPAPAAEPAPATEESVPPADTQEEVAPVEPEGSKYPTLSVGIMGRTGLAIDLGNGELSLNDGLVDQVHVRPYFSAGLTDWFGFDFGLEIGTPNGLGAIAVLDAIAKLKIVDEFQIWIGQHIPANDRNNMNGPFFHNSWNFAIGVPSYPFDTGARDRGATIWGLIAGGVLKYHASIVDAQPGAEFGDLRYAGRLTLHLLEPENFYYNSGTYFGEQDILSFGVVAQYANGSDPDPTLMQGPDNDFVGISADMMYEQNYGSGGTLTLEGGYWNFEGSGSDYIVNQGTADIGMGVTGPQPGQAFMVNLSWLTPNKIGVGKLQPNARIQYGDYDGIPTTITLDVGLAYVIDGYNHRWHLNYRHVDVDGGANTDLIQIGVQAMAFN